MTSESALQHLTSGTYQRDLDTSAGATWTINTEIEWTLMATNIVADDSKDAMFSWVRYQLWVVNGVDVLGFEYAVIRCAATEGLQDLNDNAVMEALQKEGRIFDRGLRCFHLYSTPPHIKGEFKMVKLPDGEELRLVIRPLFQGSTDATFLRGILEWREMGA